jgi:proteasome lid subunit RPN8/RPN11
MKSGGENLSLEYQRYGRNKATLVNKTYIESGEYRRKFDGITDNPAVNKTLYESAKKALKHRSGTLFEDMYWIDADTGELILEVTDSAIERKINYTDNIKKKLNENKDRKIITLHTHPGSMPPSLADFNVNNQYEYWRGVVAGHNGKVFVYNSEEYIGEIMYNLYNNKLINKGFPEYEAQIKAIEEISRNCKISFNEIK